MTYNGQLFSNEIFGAVYNMIISQEVFADNIGKHQTLVDRAKIDGGLFGDTKLFYATDALASYPWTNHGTGTVADTNLLVPHRPNAPHCQAITLDLFRQVPLTVDSYLSKRMWSNEGAFSQFNSVMLGWMAETKKIYEGTLYNVFVGCTETALGKQLQTITLTGTDDAQHIAEKVANILVELGDYSRDFNDLGYLRSYNEADVDVIWNSKFINKIKKLDLPTIFHKEFIDKLSSTVLPARYFGRAVDVLTDVGSDKVIGTTGEVDATKGSVRSKVEKKFIYDGVEEHYFPGDLLKTGMKVAYTGGSVSLPDFEEDEVYIEDEDVICKIVTKLPPLMSAFEVGTSFFNAQNLSENHYLTWGYNTLQYFVDKPFITLRKA